MDITTMTLEQLKAFAYDQIGLLEQTQNNLRVLNEEIRKKSIPPTVVAVEPETDCD